MESAHNSYCNSHHQHAQCLSSFSISFLSSECVEWSLKLSCKMFSIKHSVTSNKSLYLNSLFLLSAFSQTSSLTVSDVVNTARSWWTLSRWARAPDMIRSPSIGTCTEHLTPCTHQYSISSPHLQPLHIKLHDHRALPARRNVSRGRQ